MALSTPFFPLVVTVLSRAPLGPLFPLQPEAFQVAKRIADDLDHDEVVEVVHEWGVDMEPEDENDPEMYFDRTPALTSLPQGIPNGFFFFQSDCLIFW